MSNFIEKIGKVVAEVLASTVGWLFCMSVLIGAYELGRFAAGLLGMSDDQAMAGLLSAVTVVWIYEHRDSQHKYERLCERLDGFPR